MRKVCLLLLFIRFVSSPIDMHAQSNPQEGFIHAFREVDKYYGSVMLDTTYGKWDTAILKERFPNESADEMGLLRIYNADLKNIYFYNLPSDVLSKIGTRDSLYSRREFWWKLDFSDSFNTEQFDSLLYGFSAPKYDSDSARALQQFVINSSFQQRKNEKYNKRRPKLMTVVSVFEAERFYLVIYVFTELISYPHYYLMSELVPKPFK